MRGHRWVNFDGAPLCRLPVGTEFARRTNLVHVASSQNDRCPPSVTLARSVKAKTVFISMCGQARARPTSDDRSWCGFTVARASWAPGRFRFSTVKGWPRNGAVLITVNYRLGRLGFLAHPELSKEADYGASGNYGLLDQIAALKWVQKNAEAFGGDPDCVTIFGQSAGSTSTNSLMASSLTDGLFHRAIGQSGGTMGKRTKLTLADAERAGAAFCQALDAKSIDDLRSVPARKIQLIRPREGNKLKEFYDSNDPGALDRATAAPIVDGYFLKDKPRRVFEAGAQNDVPLMSGATEDEGATLPGSPTTQAFAARLRDQYPAAADAFLAIYNAASDSEADKVSRRWIGSRVNWENWIWAKTHARTAKSPVFFYISAEDFRGSGLAPTAICLESWARFIRPKFRTSSEISVFAIGNGRMLTNAFRTRCRTIGLILPATAIQTAKACFIGRRSPRRVRKPCISGREFRRGKRLTRIASPPGLNMKS